MALRRSAALLGLLGSCCATATPSLTIDHAVRHDIGPPLDVTLGRFTPRRPSSAAEIANRFPAIPDPLQQITPAIQRSASGLRTPEPLLFIRGLDALEAGRLVPPDPVLDVSPTHLLLWVNTAFAIHDRQTGERLTGPIPGNALWAGFGGPCESANEGDPLVVYDDFAGRWVLSQMAISAQRQCVAVSVSSNPFGAYARYEFAFPRRNDFAKLAVWTDGGDDGAYLMSVHEFDGNSFAGSSLVALERRAMLSGQPARMLRSALFPEYGIQPVHLDGPYPAVPGSCAPFVHFALPPFPAAYRFWNFCADWTQVAGAGVHGPIDLPAEPSYVPYLEPAPQPGLAPGLPAFGAYTMYRASARRLGPDAPEALSLVLTHTVRAGPAQGALRWTRFELSSDRIHATGFGDTPHGKEPVSPRITAAGSYAPDGNTRFLGAVALDRSGNLAAGYHVTGPSQPAVLRRSGRLQSDPEGLLQDEAACGPSTGGVQVATHGRFGDYASLSMDPVEHCTAYFAGQVLPTSSAAEWTTHVCAWRQPSCGTPDYAFAPPVQRRFEFCGRDQPVLRLPFRLGVLDGYSGLADLGFAGVPAGAAVDLPPSIPIPGGAEIALTDLDRAVHGDYPLMLSARSGSRLRTQSWILSLWQPLSTPPSLREPAANANGQRWRPNFRFEQIAGARTYRIEVATDPEFTTLVGDAVLRETHWQMPDPLQPGRRYWWRVRAENACGVSAWSEARSLTTRPETCSTPASAETPVALDFTEDEAGFTSGGSGSPMFERRFAPWPELPGMAYGLPNLDYPALAIAESPEWTLPVGLEDLQLRLRHAVRLESAGSVVCIDGARLDWALDGNDWLPVPDSRFDLGRPDGRSNAGHPLAGDTWCRSGRIDSIVDLSNLGGRRLRLRFAVASVGPTSAPAPNGYWLEALSINGCRTP